MGSMASTRVTWQDVLLAPEDGNRASESGLDRDPLARLESLDAPTGDIEQMLAEIESGRA